MVVGAEFTVERNFPNCFSHKFHLRALFPFISHQKILKFLLLRICFQFKKIMLSANEWKIFESTRLPFSFQTNIGAHQETGAYHAFWGLHLKELTKIHTEIPDFYVST